MSLAQTLGADALTLGRLLASKGRGKDTMLAHINPREAAILKAHGGSGGINPDTGLPEFDDTGALPTEAVTVTAPAQAPPSIDIPAPIIPQFTKPQAPLAAPAQQAAPANVAPATATTTAAAPDPYAPAPPVAQQQVQANPISFPANFGMIQAPDLSAPEDAGGLNDFLKTNRTAIELGGLGALGLYGGMQNAKASGQGQQLESKLATLAQPQQSLGNAALTSTMAGNLNQPGAEALQAAQAQTAQAQSGGAVSSQQAAEAISTVFSNLLNTQLNQAITLLNSADQYLQEAYLQGYNANVATQQNTTQFYSGLAELAVQMAGGGGTTINLPGATA